MDFLYKKLATGLARKALVALATWLTLQGVLDKADLPIIISKVAELTPALIALIWDFYEKSKDAKQLHVATQASGLSAARIAQDAKFLKLGQMP
jgi:hypothetical protein